jgi:hypothetical protein
VSSDKWIEADRKHEENAGAKTMSGKIFIWLLTTVLRTTAPLAEARQPTKIPLIGRIIK